MKRHSKMAAFAGCCFALLVIGCSQQQKAAPDTLVADEAAIRDADMAWSKAAEAKDLDAHNGYFVEDAVVLAPNEAIITGKAPIRAKLGEYFAMPGFSIKWQPNKVEVARSGDLAYSMGTYENAINDPKGNPVADNGKYVTIWKKQADGTWKVAVDMFNSDLPAPEQASK